MPHWGDSRSAPFVLARGAPRRLRRGDPVAGTQESRAEALDPRFRGGEWNLDCQLICIPPAQVRDFWPHVSPLIAAAMRKGRLTDFADVERVVLAGGALLWLAWTGETIKAAAVTQLGQANGEKFCTIVACGGRERGGWLHLIAGLERYAQAEGCAAMRIYGRRGWLKLLPAYRVARVLLEKKLPR